MDTVGESLAVLSWAFLFGTSVTALYMFLTRNKSKKKNQ